MKKILYVIILCIFINFFVSCCGEGGFPNSAMYRGFDIYFDNYYEWCMEQDKNDFYTQKEPNGSISIIDRKTGIRFQNADNKNYKPLYVKLNGSGYVYGKSEWKDWQSEEGKLLRPYIDVSKIGNDFNGKFRIIINGDSYVYIVFNDNNNTCVCFATFYGDFEYDKGTCGWTYDKSLWEKEEKENEFSYSCWLRKIVGRYNSDFANGCSDSNRARITIKKLENTDSDNIFGYTLNIQGKNIIDCKMYNYKYQHPNHEQNSLLTKECIETVEKNYSWTIFNVYRKDIHGNWIEASRFDEKEITFPVIYDPAGCSARDGALCCYDMSIREIDEEKKTISINIIDEDNCAFADYFTYFHNEDNDKRVIKYYKIKDGVPEVVKTIKGDRRNRLFFQTFFEEQDYLEKHSLYGKEKY